MLHALFPSHKLDLKGEYHDNVGPAPEVEMKGTYHSFEPRPGLITPQQESSTPLQQQSDIVNINAQEIVQADFEHVEDKVRRDHTELGEHRNESQVLMMK